MLVCTEGKERTLEEYSALLRAAGFADVQGQLTGAPWTLHTGDEIMSHNRQDRFQRMAEQLPHVERRRGAGRHRRHRTAHHALRVRGRPQPVSRNSRASSARAANPTWQNRGGHRLWVAPEVAPPSPITYAVDNFPVEIKVRRGAIVATAPSSRVGLAEADRREDGRGRRAWRCCTASPTGMPGRSSWRPGA